MIKIYCPGQKIKSMENKSYKEENSFGIGKFVLFLNKVIQINEECKAIKYRKKKI
jgi:hypothetical protein